MGKDPLVISYRCFPSQSVRRVTISSRRQLANAIRALSMDAVQRANSGHPGAPMGMADIAEVLWNDFFRHNPANPGWVDRDRFVMSNGHGSMLLYSILHLTGYDLPMEELRNFRQLHSKTPGHPEYGYTPGIETTTGPLGQGLANAVGMAIAERTLAAQFNRAGLDIVDHYTYASAGDGCLMEGISHEACSLAGTLGLGKLIVIYDSNRISIDGEVEGWFTEDVPQRFDAYRWHVIPGVDGHNPDDVSPGHPRGAGGHRQAQPSSTAKPLSAWVRPTSRARLPATARPWARTRLRWRGKPSAGPGLRLKFPQKSTGAGTPGNGARSSKRNGMRNFPSTPNVIRKTRPSSRAGSRATCRRTGRKPAGLTLRPPGKKRKASPRARRHRMP